MKAVEYRVKYLVDATYESIITTPDEKIDWDTQKVDGKDLAQWIKDHSSLGKIDFQVREKDLDVFLNTWSRLMATLPKTKVCAFVRSWFSSTLFFGFFSFGFLTIVD